LSKLVGAKGQVIGVDMTSEQLEVANRHIDFHRQNFGFQKSNVTFKQGYIEDLSSAGIASNSVDVVVSNCVVNLSPDKESVFREVYRILKPGGEFYFSDVYANKRVPKHLLDDNTLLGECLAGALYTEDFRRLMYKAGFYDPRIVTKSQIALTDPVIARKIGMIDFQSITYRCFKIPELEDRCEDYGQVAYYLGSIENMPHSFALDDHHLFQTGKPHLVCSNTAFMLSHTRYSKHFRVEGDLSTHFGLFDCATPSVTTSSTSGACC
jgi:SAM-dependent methyltransferase